MNARARLGWAKRGCLTEAAGYTIHLSVASASMRNSSSISQTAEGRSYISRFATEIALHTAHYIGHQPVKARRESRSA